ncbi:protein-lysine N-methyltransferase EEF2KMT-like isoform X1 [Penaeus chinensis]|uniref:protein-lysine N-methyltransferase EEF2KMT-like isoform X1 n=1 Tax=Penaeus chinensis TaxID=139456 RepID=UPI001FB671C3|nr:protein-lysine N-methyltransferase EEF2KMT-like isoform X1 [Penaeus chinensis]
MMDYFLKDISWKYLRMYPLKDIIWKDINDILINLEHDESMSFQENFLSNTVQHPIAKRFPPTMSYARMFLKSFIEQIEGSNQEVCEEVYLVYTDFITQSVSLSTDLCYRTYRLQPDCVLTIKETRKLISDGTTGLFTWEAGHVLAEWCSENKPLFRNKKVLELGSGLGLMGLAVIKICEPASYIFTDLPTTVLTTLAENVKINLESDTTYEISSICDWTNGMETSYNHTKVNVRRLDWEQDSCDITTDIILAADVVYDPAIVNCLVDTLKTAMNNNPGAVAVVACTLRNSDTLAFFKDALAKGKVKISWETQRQHQESPSRPQSIVSLLQLSL